MKIVYSEKKTTKKNTMFKVLFFCLIVKNENEERWQSLKSTYSKQKKNTKRKIRCSTLQTQTQKIQQLWAINEYQKTAYPSRAHTHTHEKDEGESEKREKVNQTVKKRKTTK